VLAAVTLTVTLAALLASLRPALAAGSVDPAQVLREE
jgi:ABC-type lipoprotein release transport system permease subunit